MKVGIIFPVINHLDLTRAAVASVQSKHETFIVIVDNGSTDGTPAWAVQTDRIGSCINNQMNAGLTVAWNQGVKKCRDNGCEYILIANNDIVLHPQVIDNLVADLEAHPDWWLLSAVNDRGWADEHGGPEAIKNKPIPEQGSVRPHPDFSCFMVRATLFDELAKKQSEAKEPNPGWFDEEFSRIGKAFYEDNDFHYRLHKAGMFAGCTDRAPYYHYASVTATSIGVGGGANSVYFSNKHGGPPNVVFPH